MTPDVFAELSPPYSTIVVDPPWPYPEGWPGFSETSHGGDVVDHRDLPYSAMSLDEIARAVRGAVRPSAPSRVGFVGLGLRTRGSLMTADAEPVERLIAAWEAWDRAPANRVLVARRQDALEACAQGSWLVLQRRVETLRRTGRTAREAIEQAVGPTGPDTKETE